MKSRLLPILFFLPIVTIQSSSAENLWKETGATSTGRSNHSAAMLSDGRILVTGGRQSDVLAGGILRTAEVFDPSTGKWTSTGMLNTGRQRLETVRLDSGKVLVIGGQVGRNATPSASCETFDPSTGKFTLSEVMNHARESHVALRLSDGRVLVIGGAAEASAEIYDPTKNSWTLTPPMNHPRGSHAASLLKDGRVLVMGGDPKGKTVEIYDPGKNRWAEVRAMDQARTEHTSTVLNDGRVLVTGGAGSASRSAEIYDPKLNSWSKTASLPREMRLHTATLLLNGQVLAAGGYTVDGDSPQRSSSAFIFDPAQGKWKNAASMNQPHAAHAAILLSDGRLLVIAGGTFSGNSEIYEP